MSNSWKRYGSNKVYDKGRIFRTENVITERFTFQGDFDGNIILSSGNFITENGNLKVGENTDISTVLVRDKIRFQNIDNGVYITGDFSNIGINVLHPNAILDISGNAETILQVYSSLVDTKNVITKNVNEKGIVTSVDASGSAVHFYHSNFSLQNGVDSSSGGFLQYRSDDVFELDTSTNLSLRSNLISLSTNTDAFLENTDATVLIQDKKIGVGSSSSNISGV